MMSQIGVWSAGGWYKILTAPQSVTLSFDMPLLVVAAAVATIETGTCVPAAPQKRCRISHGPLVCMFV
jgi:hypothetical protein